MNWFTMDLYKAAFLLGILVCSGSSTTVPELNCLTGDGEAYRGTIAWTWTGKTCQRWSDQTPHKHEYTTEKYPNKGLENNYCRNPDKSFMPWCYTTDPNARWEYCRLPFCGTGLQPGECMQCNGENYRGKLSTTESNLPCQRWDSQHPHKHDYSPNDQKGLTENYCRNPSGEPWPWCYTTDPSKRWEYCSIPRCSSEPPPVVPEVQCFSGKGQAYRGTVALTESGRVCQRWSSQRPHQHTRTPCNYACKDLEENYCRNPDDSDRPWCYTTDPETRWEYCNIPSCTQ